MILPCRASTCDHLQCFDASLYLKMNEKKAKWLCPVCNKPALYDNLVRFLLLYLHFNNLSLSISEPRNSRTFYLQIPFFTIGKNTPKFIILGIFHRLFAQSSTKKSLLALQFSLSIRGTLGERIYREL